MQSDIKRGDVIELGRHRLMCGDAFEPADVDALMQGETPDLVFTDPPYNVGGGMSAGLYSSSDAKADKWLGPAMRGLAAAEWDRAFDVDALCVALDRVRPENGTVYVCASHRTAGRIWQWMDESGATHSNYCVWCKPNPMPSLAKRHPTWATELICYATFGRHPFNFPETGHALNWWTLSKNTPERVHPTQKPASLAITALTYSSDHAGLVVDLFAGSGSTLLAAEHLDRRACVMEIDPHYCAVIVERYQMLTEQLRLPLFEQGVA